MAKDLEKNFKENMERLGLKDPGQGVLLGISGGADSLCLLHLLAGLLPEWEMPLYAVHVDHGIRGAASAEDREKTEAFCAGLNVPCAVYCVDVPGQAAEKGLGLEETARLLRYEAFAEELKRCGARYLALAHNRDDQAETVLLRLLRGSGPDGLAAMEEVKEDGTIRPLLRFSSGEIREYCREKGLSPCQDRTNEDETYSRNRIRKELLPLLETYNPAIRENLFRFSCIAAEDRDFFRELAGAMPEPEMGRLRFGREELAQMHPALLKRFLLQALRTLGLWQNVSGQQLERACEFIRKGKIGRFAQFPEGYLLEIDTEGLLIKQERADLSQKSFCEPLTPEGELLLPDGRLIRTGLAEGPEAAQKCREMQGCRDAICLPLSRIMGAGQPVWRYRREGDRLYPKGLEGSKKLQDLFVDRKIPRDERDRIPLLCLGQTVIWLPGGPLHRDHYVKDPEEPVIIIEIVNKM